MVWIGSHMGIPDHICKKNDKERLHRETRYPGHVVSWLGIVALVVEFLGLEGQGYYKIRNFVWIVVIVTLKLSTY